MLNKALCVANGNQAPEPGYVKAELFVGRLSTGYSSYFLGFFENALIGTLTPNLGYTELFFFVERLGSVPPPGEDPVITTTVSVVCTRPFYVKNKKYTDGQEIPFEEIPFEFGETVEVWLAPE